MNEKFYILLGMAQRSALQAGSIAANAAYGMSKRAEEMLATAKLRSRLTGLENDIEASLIDVGRMVYATHIGTPTESDLLTEKLEEIDGLSAELDSLRQDLGYQLGTCPYCGAKPRAKDRFCRECGGKL